MSLVTSTPTVLICSSRCESAHYFAGGVWTERTHPALRDCYAGDFRLSRWTNAVPKSFCDGRLGGAHAPSRAVSSAPARNIGRMVALRKEFDEGVEPDSRGRLCSPFGTEMGV